jgi:hypothetical protein
MNIVVIPGTNYNNAPAGFDTAVKYVTNLFDSLFTANVTVYINVDYGIIDSTNQSVPPLGRSNWNLDSFSYSTVRQALINMGAPGSNTLPTTSPFPNATLWLTTAQEKALGFLAANFRPGPNAFYPNADGYVGVASNATLMAQQNGATWSFSPTATPGANQFYIVGTLEHEFSEVLGRSSFDGSNAIQNAPSYTIMDLFRYSQPGVRQLSATSSNAYFSTDNGNHVYYYWNTHDAASSQNFDVNGDLGDWWKDGGIVNGQPFQPTGPDAFLDLSPPGQINGISSFDQTLMQTIGWSETPVTPATNPPPPAGTTADMILRHGADGKYEIYDIGANSLLAAYQVGQVGTDWTFVTLGGFNGSDTTDMLLRNSAGAFEVYDISNNNITNAASLGAVGTNWQVMGFGNFSSFGENDMILRNSSNAQLEVYDLRNNQIIGANSMGAVGLNWQFSGVGNFSGRGTSDMMLRNSNTGDLEVYDINSNRITGAAFIGAVGVNWQFSGVGNFSGVPGETDLLLRNSNTGGLEVYDINHNQLTGAAFIGTVGLDWQFAGIAPIHAAGASDLVLRNVNSGAFEVYDIVSNTLVGAASLGAVGTDWSLGGFAADPPTASAGSMDGSSQAAQLVQAMAGFSGGGSGAAESLNTVALGSDPSQQSLLTTPQHA